MKTTLLLLACLVAPIPARAAVQAPLGLECSYASVVHSQMLPDTKIDSEDQASLNRCISTVQDYARAHCPKSSRTIWQQIEAVAYSGPGIPDTEALVAACR